MTTKDLLLKELAKTSEETLTLVLSFVQFLNATQAQETLETAALSESTLSKDLAVARGGRGLATFVRGDVVVVPFPFSDLTQAKRRPALVER